MVLIRLDDRAAHSHGPHVVGVASPHAIQVVALGQRVLPAPRVHVTNRRRWCETSVRVGSVAGAGRRIGPAFRVIHGKGTPQGLASGKHDAQQAPKQPHPPGRQAQRQSILRHTPDRITQRERTADPSQNQRQAASIGPEPSQVDESAPGYGPGPAPRSTGVLPTVRPVTNTPAVRYVPSIRAVRPEHPIRFLVSSTAGHCIRVRPPHRRPKSHLQAATIMPNVYRCHTCRVLGSSLMGTRIIGHGYQGHRPWVPGSSLMGTGIIVDGFRDHRPWVPGSSLMGTGIIGHGYRDHR